MKVVINACFGGFSLSPRAIKRLAELQGRKCYFFRTNFEKGQSRRTPITLEQLEMESTLFFSAYDIPNPDEALPDSSTDRWITLPMEERAKINEEWDTHSLDSRPEDRTDPLLVKVVEELGSGHRKGASGACADLKVVEIPDGTEYEIDEYDGNESIHEVHRSWS